MLHILSAIAWWLFASLIGAGSTLFSLVAKRKPIADTLLQSSPQHHDGPASHPPPPPSLPEWAFSFEFSPGKKYERPCSTPATIRKWQYCNTSLSDAERISWLLDHLSPQEKISLLGNNAAAVPRLSLPPYNWWSESLHGVSSTCCPGIRFKSTSFPQVCTTGASFNRSLFQAIGTAIGDEAVEHYYRLGDIPGLTFWSPNVNLFRDPRWGRGQEVPGEDPYLNGQYAAALVPAMQYGKGDRSADRPRIAAACKHLAAYSVETGRMAFDAKVDDRDMEESYLPAFKQCVDSGVLGFMCSYNAINGVPSCANANLLTAKLRDEWGFNGYVTGDCGAVGNIYPSHHYTNSTVEGVAAAFRAGVDTDCAGDIQKYGQAALDAGYLSVQDIDRALRNLFNVQFRLGYYSPLPAPFQSQNIEEMKLQRRRLDEQVHMHSYLAVEAARQGIVLLKNGHTSTSRTPTTSGRPLPLSQNKHQRIALVGPNADAEYTMLGNYFGVPPLLVSPKQGLEDMGVSVTYHKGCNITAPSLDSDMDEICDAAVTSDATILVMGNNGGVENEGQDRTSISLPGAGQVELIQLASSCSKQHGKVVILVIMSGGPIDLSLYKDDENIDAILYVGYPGQAGGTAIAEIMYGLANPSGRLATTIYPQQFAEQVDITDMRMRPSGSFPGRTYRYYTGKVVYPFGFGLSYSRFEKTLSVEGDLVKVNAEVYNRGPLDGAYSLLLFHSGPNAGKKGNPLRSLVAFDKIFLNAGETKIVPFSIDTTSSVIRREAGLHRFSLAADEEKEVYEFVYEVLIS